MTSLVPTLVFPGQFWAGGAERALADGFRGLGWSVQEIDSRDHMVNSGGQLALKLADRLFRSAALKRYQETILETCESLRPEVLLTVKGAGLSRELLDRIRDLSVRTVMYYPDRDFVHPDVWVDSFPGYDLFVTTKTFQIEYLERLLGKNRVAHVHHGYVDRVHRPLFPSVNEQDYRCDVLYAGNHTAYKAAWLGAGLGAIADVSAEIVGNRWRRAAMPELPARGRILGERVGPLYAAAIQGARISIAIHSGPDAAGWEDRVSGRTFEIPACAGFMLHIDNDEVRDLFTPGEEIDVFASPEELADKIRFYLPRPDLRARMIARAYARAVPNYGYDAVAKRMRTLMAERLDL